MLNDCAHPAGPLLNRAAVEKILARPIGNTSVMGDRPGLECVRSLGAWINEYGVSITA